MPTSGTLEPGTPSRPGPMPDGPRPYPQLLRGGRRHWWKPLLALLMAGLGVVLTAGGLVYLVPAVAGLVLGVDDLGAYVARNSLEGDLSAVGFLALNLSLAALIPVAGLTTWAVHRVRPRNVSSVVGGLRWRWLARCFVVLAPLWVLYFTISVLADPPPAGRPPQWVALLVVSLLTTPLQCAGEEYFFRGFLLQNLGAWFARPLLALLVPGAISACLFAAAHGSPDPWVLGDLGAFAVAATLMAWRTGGLEAGIALHSINNLLSFGVVIVVGGWQDAFVGSDTTSTPGVLAISVVFQASALGLVWWQARRTGVQRLYRPPAVARASTGFLAVGPAPASLSGRGLAGERPADGRQA